MQKTKNNLRIAFMGTPSFSATILEKLLNDGYDVTLAFSQSDKPVGRKRILEKSPVKILCEKNNIPLYTPKKIDADANKLLIDFQIDLIILVAYGKILPATFLAIPPLGAINIHPSLLPKFRGPSPIQNALWNGETTTGSTIMLMDAGVDTGDILRQKEINITPQETYLKLEKKLASFSSSLLLETLEDFLKGNIIPQKQDSSKASYCKLIRREDGQIDWNNNALSIYNQFRALSGWPGIFTYWNVNNHLKRLKLNIINSMEGAFPEYQIGEVFLEKNLPCVKTTDGAIIISELQLEGKSVMSGNDFINGYKNFITTILK